MIRGLTVAAYTVLGSVLAWSRLAGLDNWGYCCDEIATVVESVRTGPWTILTGPYTPNNHQLFSIFGWAGASVLGESEIVLRLGAAVPFILGVVVATSWLHVRIGALAAVLFLAFATMSPLLLDLSRLARGYGLAFLAMSVMVVAALEADRTRRTAPLVAFWIAGVAGAWTLPHFAIAFGTAGAVLLLQPRLRSRCLAGAGLSILAIAVWYAPHIDDIAVSASQDYGAPIRTAWLVTAPFDQVLLPGLTSLDEILAHPSRATLIASVGLAVVIGSSPLLRHRHSALVLCAPAVVTLVTFWATNTQVVPRFFSFLLVPLLILTATGGAAALQHLESRPVRFRVTGIVTVVFLVLLAFTAVPVLASVPGSRRDAIREAAEVIRADAPDAPVLAYMPHPADLEFHLERPVQHAAREVHAVCGARETAVLVTQPWFWPDAPTPRCSTRPGTRHVRLTQFARGKATDVWIIPPA